MILGDTNSKMFTPTKLDSNAKCLKFVSQIYQYIWFSPYVIAAMLVDEKTRTLISSFCSSTSTRELYIAALLSVFLKFG